MAVATAKAVLERVQEVAILEAGPLQEAQALLARFPDHKDFVQELVRRHWLTAFQARALLQGSELVLGPYLLLDVLGEGGSGQVYKARQRPTHRLVALKTLRAELLADPETVQRFYREIRVTSKVAHANVVRAVDAGPIGATHVLAMEYVAGIDLERRVKDQGPLPVAEALDYLRQAALGLQHIHECGLVHRDIKPSNLMLVTGSAEEDRGRTQIGPQAPHQVKILDLGLARLHRSTDSQVSASLSANGSVMMGTPDYMAPEQAVDFHQADIRADIYSLGCVAYFLLTGRPPFGGGSLTQKLMKHHQAEPPAIQTLRPDVPRPLAPILARMLAKQPPQRYSEPGQVAAALTQLLDGTESRTPRRGRRRLLAGATFLAIGAACVFAFLMASGPDSRATRPEAAQGQPPAHRATTVSPVVATRTSPSATMATRVFQGPGLVQDALIDGQEPERRLGGEPRNNQLKKNPDGSAFLMRFDLDKAGYPGTARVEKATLVFYVWDPHNRVRTRVGLFALRTPWVESQATWKQPADGKQWQGGATFVPGVDTGPVLASVIVEPDRDGDVADPPIAYAFDLVPLVQSWIDGSTPNHGVALIPVPDRAIDDGFQSRMQVTATEYKVRQTPQLAVTVRY